MPKMLDGITELEKRGLVASWAMIERAQLLREIFGQEQLQDHNELVP